MRLAQPYGHGSSSVLYELLPNGADVRQVAVLLGVVDAVANDELVGALRRWVADREAGDLETVWRETRRRVKGQQRGTPNLLNVGNFLNFCRVTRQREIATSRF